MASLEDEVTLVLQASRDEMATRDPWGWMASLDFQAPKGKREYQETSAPGETKGKTELLGLQDPQGPLEPGARLATLGKMAPGGLKVQRVPKESPARTATRAPKDPQGPRGMMGHRANLGSLDPQGPRVSQGAWGPEEKAAWTVPRDQRGSLAMEVQTEPRGPGVHQASRASRGTLW